MTPVAAECGYKSSSYHIGYSEATSIGINMTKQLVLSQIYVFIKKSWFQHQKLLLNGIPETIL